MLVAEKSALSIDEFLALPDHEWFELVGGELVERSMNPEAVMVGGKFYRVLDDYCQLHRIGWAFPDGVGFVLGAHYDRDYCKPDASVVLHTRLPDGQLPPAAFDFAPDLAVEVVSPSDAMSKIERKIAAYLEAGTQLVWLARPTSRRILAFHADGTETSFGPNDLIDADPVLPGLRFRVGEVFPLPAART